MSDNAIDEKKKQISLDNNVVKQNDWGAFAGSVFYNLITVMLVGLVGANFIFFTTFADLNKFFTTQQTPNYFPSAYAKPQQSGGSCQNMNLSKDKLSFNYEILEKIGVGKNGGWPYSMVNKSSGLFQTFKNWFAYTAAETFIFNKRLLKDWLALFAPNNKYVSNQTFQMLFVSQITLFIGVFASLTLGFWGHLYHGFKENWFVSLIGLVFGYTLFFATMTSIVNFVKFLGVFLLVPLISNINILGDILRCNSNSLALLFGALVLGSAYSTLDNSISVSMTVVYVLLIIKTLFF